MNIWVKISYRLWYTLQVDLTTSSLRKDNSDNHSVESKSLTEDENQNHADEDLFLLGVCSHTCITNNTNSKTGSLDVGRSNPTKYLQEMKDRSIVLKQGAYILSDSCIFLQELFHRLDTRACKKNLLFPLRMTATISP
jgi:hypothetical protein